MKKIMLYHSEINTPVTRISQSSGGTWGCAGGAEFVAFKQSRDRADVSAPLAPRIPSSSPAHQIRHHLP